MRSRSPTPWKSWREEGKIGKVKLELIQNRGKRAAASPESVSLQLLVEEFHYGGNRKGKESVYKVFNCGVISNERVYDGKRKKRPIESLESCVFTRRLHRGQYRVRNALTKLTRPYEGPF